MFFTLYLNLYIIHKININTKPSPCYEQVCYISNVNFKTFYHNRNYILIQFWIF